MNEQGIFTDQRLAGAVLNATAAVERIRAVLDHLVATDAIDLDCAALLLIELEDSRREMLACARITAGLREAIVMKAKLALSTAASRFMATLNESEKGLLYAASRHAGHWDSMAFLRTAIGEIEIDDAGGDFNVDD